MWDGRIAAWADGCKLVPAPIDGAHPQQTGRPDEQRVCDILDCAWPP
jgi:hypothetical protein